jgi:hypothetical protein
MGALLPDSNSSPVTNDASLPNSHFRGRLITAGRIRNALGEPGHIDVPAQAIQEAIAEGQFDGLACFIDHPGFFESPSLRNLFGTWHSVNWNEETHSADGQLRYYATTETTPIAQRLHEILADNSNGDPIPNVGVSIVFYPEWEKRNKEDEFRTIKRFKKIESADLVFSPAADGRILEALSALTVGALPRVRPLTANPPSGGQNMPVLIAPLPASAQADPAPVIESTGAPTCAPSSRPPAAVATPVAPPPAAPLAIPQEWLDAIANAASAAIDARLTPALADLVGNRIVELSGPPPRAAITSVRHASQDVMDAVDWMFGVPNAPTPEPRLRNSAELYRLLTGDIHFRGVFDAAEALAAANVTTLADLAVNAMNKVIIDTWDGLSLYRWYELVTTVQPNDGSLQDMAWIQFGGIGDLPVVAEGAAYTEASVVDSKEADSFIKYGYYVGITRKMIKNSEIARMQAVPRALAISAIRNREAKIAAIFTTASGVGPTLDDDSVVLFHTVSHGNLATTAFSYAAWSAARLECYKLTEAGSSRRLGFWPKFWLGPADLYDSALEIFGYGSGPGGKPGTADNNVNPFAQDRVGDPRPIPIAIPSFTDVNDWAYLVDPMIQPIIQMSYSQNPGGRTHPVPELFSVVSETAGLMFTNDTMPIKVRDEFAYGVSGYRGIGKRNVT